MCEVREWIGCAILRGSVAGEVLRMLTVENLSQRAKKINQKYTMEFGDKFSRLHLKSIIPFIY